MRPSMAGSFSWKTFDDTTGPVDNMRRLFDIQMRIPRGDAHEYFSGNVLDGYPGEDSNHYYKRLVASHLVYLNNSMSVGGYRSLMSMDDFDPHTRTDSLELVNKLRRIRGLESIEIAHDGASWPTAALANQIHRVKANGQEYDICYCRRTRTRIMPELLLEQDEKVEALKALIIPGTDQIALSPNFFNSTKETWLHRAIAHQESRYLARKKDATLATIMAFPETCNGILNNCQECEYCFENVAHLEMTNHLRSNSFHQVNVSHCRTPDEGASGMMLSYSVIAPCIDCNFHFGLFARNKYFADIEARWSCDHQLETTETSEGPYTKKQRTSELFAKHLVREALLGATVPTPNVGNGLRFRRRKGDAIVANAVSLLASLQSQIVDATVMDDYKLYASQIYHYNSFYWNDYSVTDNAIREMQARTKTTLDEIVPTGYIAKKMFDDPKTPKNAVLTNLFGSVMFPPCVAQSISHADFIFNVKNMINADQGKPQFRWEDLVTARMAMGGTLGNPDHEWPKMIGLSLSLEPYWLLAKEVARGEKPASVMNVCDSDVSEYYTRRFDEYFDGMGCDESTFITTKVEPWVKKLYKIASRVQPKFTDPRVLEQLKTDNDGVLPDPLPSFKDRRYLEQLKQKNNGVLPHPVLTAKEKKLFSSSMEQDWHRIFMLITECWLLRHFAMEMKNEIAMNGGSTSCSWDRLTTPSSVIAGFYSHLEQNVRGYYNNLSYRSLVSFFWPIPVQHMNDPTQFLMEGMWEWYIFTRRLDHLVQETLLAPDTVPAEHLGDSISVVPTRVLANSISKQERYFQFARKVGKILQSPNGQDDYLDTSWRMDSGWMIQFWADWRQRLAEQVYGIKPSLNPMIPAVPQSSRFNMSKK